MTSRSRGGEGGCPKHDVVREVAWIYSYDWSKMRDKGGRGSEKPQNLRDVIYGWSLMAFTLGQIVTNHFDMYTLWTDSRYRGRNAIAGMTFLLRYLTE